MNRTALPNARYLQSISISSAIFLLLVLQGCGTGSSNILPSPASNSDGYISISGAHFIRNGVVWAPHGINCVAFNATPSTRTGLFGAAYNNFNAAELAAMKAWGADTIRFQVAQAALDSQDPTTRTAQARIEVANPDESLRLDMYMDVAFTSSGSKALAIPESAVQAIGEKQYVFLPVKDSDGSFAVRQVKLGPVANGFYAVLEGLKINDEVVTDGSFILKAEAIRQHPEL